MKQYTVTEYDNADIARLDHMSRQEVIDVLESIDNGWLPRDYVWDDGDPDTTYTESQYQATMLHKAVRKAIDGLSKIKEA